MSATTQHSDIFFIFAVGSRDQQQSKPPTQKHQPWARKHTKHGLQPCQLGSCTNTRARFSPEIVVDLWSSLPKTDWIWPCAFPFGNWISEEQKTGPGLIRACCETFKNGRCLQFQEYCVRSQPRCNKPLLPTRGKHSHQC